MSLEQQLHDVRGHRADLEDTVFAQDRPEELRGDPKGVNAAIDRSQTRFLSIFVGSASRIFVDFRGFSQISRLCNIFV